MARRDVAAIPSAAKRCNAASSTRPRRSGASPRGRPAGRRGRTDFLLAAVRAIVLFNYEINFEARACEATSSRPPVAAGGTVSWLLRNVRPRRKLAAPRPPPTHAMPEPHSSEFALEPADPERLANLTGAFDGHLRMIELRMGVEVANRGNIFRISGPEAAVD